MSEEIREFLDRMKRELEGCDPATIQDALADAEDHLRSALHREMDGNPDLAEKDAFGRISEKYGAPEEIASVYREIESRIPPGIAVAEAPEETSLTRRILGVLIDPRAYAALFYFLLSIITGTIYFTWAVTGLSLCLGLIVLIIGIPVVALFLLSVRGVALIEGRIVEALLGERMPRRPVFSRKHLGFWGQLKFWITDGRTWSSIAYMILMLPLSVIYFTVFVTLLSISVSLIVLPFFEAVTYIGSWEVETIMVYLPYWFLWITIPAGIVDALITLHLAKALGRMQGKIAKTMLVRP